MVNGHLAMLNLQFAQCADEASTPAARAYGALSTL